MAVLSRTSRTTLQRDITEALLRLKLARATRDGKEELAQQERLNRLLDRLARDLGLGEKE
jgi:AAA+ superfamily predicted ATPase